MPGEPLLNNAIPIRGYTVRQVISILKYCSTFVSIDSFLNHASAIWRKKGIVLWGRNSADKFGYPHNSNIEKKLCEFQPCFRPDLDDFIKVGGKMVDWQCPNYICQDVTADEIIPELYKITS